MLIPKVEMKFNNILSWCFLGLMMIFLVLLMTKKLGSLDKISVSSVPSPIPSETTSSEFGFSALLKKQINYKFDFSDLTIPQKLLVYEIKKDPDLKDTPGLKWSAKTATGLAEKLGFSSQAKAVTTGTSFIWQEGAKVLSVDFESGVVNFSTSFSQKGPSFYSGEIKNKQSVLSAAKAILSSCGLLSPFFDFENPQATYYREENLNYTPVNDINETSLIEIYLTGKIFPYPVLGSQEARLQFTKKGEIVSLYHLAPLLDTENPRVVSLKSWDQIIKEVQKGQGIFVTSLDTNTESVELDNVFLAYFHNPRKRFYSLEPAVVFEGQGITLYLAIAKE